MFGYGTAGFRDKADILAPVMYRVGILAALRSRKLAKMIGVMITASHNPEPDNGAKVVDPMGEMLEASWEAHATTVANCTDVDLAAAIARIVESEGIPTDTPVSVVVARDTRPSSPALSAAVMVGIDSVRSGGTIDAGVL
jgi:phosphoacetylglucosamine mutase